jgi:protein gp37
MAQRFGWPWGAPVERPERMGQPAERRKPARIFCGSVTDLWHEKVDSNYRDKVLHWIDYCEWHTFMVLTKRPQNIALAYEWPANCWVGVTCENQRRYEERWPMLASRVGGPRRPLRWISAEPLLGPVVLRDDWAPPDWVVCGPENGRKARRCDPDWIKRLERQCCERGIAFYDKRPGAALKCWPKWRPLSAAQRRGRDE